MRQMKQIKAMILANTLGVGSEQSILNGEASILFSILSLKGYTWDTKAQEWRLKKRDIVRAKATANGFLLLRVICRSKEVDTLLEDIPTAFELIGYRLVEEPEIRQHVDNRLTKLIYFRFSKNPEQKIISKN